jgi:LPS-assembly protein
MRLISQPLLAAGLAALVLAPVTAGAQPSSSLPIEGTTTSRSRELINNNIWHFVGDVELEWRDSKLYAEEVWYYADEDRALATGNVTFTQGNNRISADRAEMDTETRLGTFFNATGMTTVQQPRQTPTPGAFVAPRLANQENDVYFFGETVEKIGPRKYKITNGGFTTCVQPTPRWNLSASTVVLHIDHHTLLQNAIFRVKDVPLLYLPIFYYPTEEDDRSTGFLIPSYGASTLRGQTLSNQFFWAIDRSQDMTLMHDWFSKTGQGYGSEYRYNFGAGSDGNVRAYRLDEKATTYVSSGSSVDVPASESYEVRGGFNQMLPYRLRARGRVDYFSSFTTMRTFNTNVYDATRNSRNYGGNVVGGWGSYTLNGTFDRNEYFSSADSSVVAGNAPRIYFARSERPIVSGSQLYFGAGSEFVSFDRVSKAPPPAPSSAPVIYDSSLSRLDVSPQLRYPFKRLQWFTVNTSLGWRGTLYTRSLDPAGTIDPITQRTRILEDNITRQYFTMQAQAVGPVFTRIWNTPDSGYAERFKHSIEPFFNAQRTTAIDNFTQIIQTDGIDGVVGNATSLTYGVNNRFYAKRRLGQTSQAQEIASVELLQSYYTDARSAQYDINYQTGYGSAPSHFSPISLRVRATPTVNFNATLRADVDSKYLELRSVSVDGAYNWTNRITTSAGWTQRYFIEGLPGFNDPNNLDHYLNLSTNVHTRDNRVGTIYSLNYDVLRTRLLQQRISAFYNAQCCGIAFEYQRYNFAGYPVPNDRRFFLSFTLAGLGNFSPFSGGLSGVPR